MTVAMYRSNRIVRFDRGAAPALNHPGFLFIRIIVCRCHRHEIQIGRGWRAGRVFGWRFGVIARNEIT